MARWRKRFFFTARNKRWDDKQRFLIRHASIDYLHAKLAVYLQQTCKRCSNNLRCNHLHGVYFTKSPKNLRQTRSFTTVVKNLIYRTEPGDILPYVWDIPRQLEETMESTDFFDLTNAFELEFYSNVSGKRGFMHDLAHAFAPKATLPIEWYKNDDY